MGKELNNLKSGKPRISYVVKLFSSSGHFFNFIWPDMGGRRWGGLDGWGFFYITPGIHTATRAAVMRPSTWTFIAHAGLPIACLTTKRRPYQHMRQ